MNYLPFKKLIVSLALIGLSALPVYAQSGRYSDVAQGVPPQYYPQGTSPGQFPGPVMPQGYHPPYPHTHYAPGSYPGIHQTHYHPNIYPGSYPGIQPIYVPGAYPGYYLPGTAPGQYPGPVMPHGYHPPYPHTHPLW